MDGARVPAQRRPRRRPTDAKRAVESFHVRNTTDADEPQPTEFGWHLLKLMKDAGYTSRAQFARHVGVSGSTVTRWIYGDVGRPDQESLGAIADALHLDDDGRNELLWRAGYDRLGDAPAQRRIDRDALRLDRLIGEGSLLPPADQDRIRTQVGYVLEPWERLYARDHRQQRHRS